MTNIYAEFVECRLCGGIGMAGEPCDLCSMEAQCQRRTEQGATPTTANFTKSSEQISGLLGANRLNYFYSDGTGLAQNAAEPLSKDSTLQPTTTAESLGQDAMPRTAAAAGASGPKRQANRIHRPHKEHRENAGTVLTEANNQKTFIFARINTETEAIGKPQARNFRKAGFSNEKGLLQRIMYP